MPVLKVKEKASSIKNNNIKGVWSGEALAFCPQCKALETVLVSNGRLMPTRKFIQEGNQIYHDCGSFQPCCLYWTYQPLDIRS